MPEHSSRKRGRSSFPTREARQVKKEGIKNSPEPGTVRGQVKKKWHSPG